MKNKKINRSVLKNLLLAVAVMLYFVIINFSYYRIEDDEFLLILKVISGIFLILGIIVLEKAYRKDNGEIAIYALEILVLSGYTFSILHVVNITNFQFSKYISISSYIMTLYYVLKSIIIAIKSKKEYLKSMSDIREIVDIKPTKKEAEKRKENN